MLDLRIKKDELLRGVSQTQSIAEKRSSMPILSNLLLEAAGGRLDITATDLEITFRGSYESEISGEGRLTVPARKFFEIVRVLGDGEFNLREDENNKLFITGQRSNYQLHGLPAEDFPPMPETNDVKFVIVPADQLADMLQKTVHSIAVEETRYNLAGVYMEKLDVDGRRILRMVSTDGHRLSLAEQAFEGLDELELPNGVIISRKGVTEMLKLADEAGRDGEIKLGAASNSAVVKSEGVVMVMRLLEGRFPDYNLVIPKKNDKNMVVGRKDLLDMLKRVSVMSNDDYKGVKFTISPKELTVTATNPDLGTAEESMPVEYESEEIVVGFNPRYFINALESLVSDTVNLALLDSGNPCLVTAPNDPGYQGVIMPMKI